MQTQPGDLEQIVIHSEILIDNHKEIRKDIHNDNHRLNHPD